MPLEIRELVIKATVTNEPQGQEAEQTETVENNESAQVQPSADLMQEVIEKVLQIIKDEMER